MNRPSPMPLTRASLNRSLREAVALMQRGRYDDAERIFAPLLAQSVSFPPLLHFAGLNAIELDRGEEGLALLRRSMALAPTDAAFRANLATALIRLKGFDEAEPLLRAMRREDPRNPKTAFALANLLHLTARDGEAITHWKECLALAPDWAQAWIGLGESHGEIGDLTEADRAYARAQALLPDDPLIRVARADLITESEQGAGDPGAARRLYEEAIKLKPHFAPAEAGLASLEGQAGAFEAALGRLRSVLERDPHAYFAAWLMARFKTFRLNDPDRKLIEQSVELAGREPKNEMAHQAFFGWGKVLEDSGEYDPAWAAFNRAHALKPVIRGYRESIQRQYMNLLLHASDASFQERYRMKEPGPVRPVYIVGMPRSGTTLIEQMLSAHTDITTCGEMVTLQNALCRGLGISDIGQLPFALNPLSPVSWRQVRAEVDRLYAERSRNRQVLTDKMPSNFMNLGLLTALYPDARVIHIQREARDTCVSCYTTLFRSSQRFTSNLAHLGRYFRMYEALMDYWRSHLAPTTLLEIRYETLVESPRETLERVLDFIGLPWQEACLHPERSDRRILTASLFQARQPIRTNSIGRWKHYARFLEPLEAALATTHPLQEPAESDAAPVPGSSTSAGRPDSAGP